MIKRICSLILIVIISMLTINGNYQTAQATGAEGLLIPIVEGGAAATGITVGGALLLTLGLVAVGCGVIIAVNNWDTIQDYFEDFCNNSNGKAKEWFNDIANRAVYINDNARTMASDIVNGLFTSINDYVLKKGENISIDAELKADFTEALKQFEELNELVPGTHLTNLDDKLMDLLTLAGVPLSQYDVTFSNYKYVIGYVKLGAGVYIACSNEPMKFFIDTVDYNWFYRMLSGTNIHRFYFPRTGSGKVYDFFSTTSIIVDTPNSIYIDRRYGYQFVAWPDSNVTLHILSTSMIEDNIYETADKRYLTIPATEGILSKVIDATNWRWQEQTAPYVPQTIRINDYLINELDDVVALDTPTTDKLIEKVIQADTVARQDKVEVIDKAIVDTVTDIPADTINDGVNDNTGLIGGLIDALKDLLEWLFVPSQNKVQSFVTEASNRWDSNNSLFAYPIELVIRFLTQVSTLNKNDCILSIPRIEFKGHVLYPGTQFNFTDYVEKSEFSVMYGYYIMITNFIMIIAVLSLAIKKGDEIIRGN